MTRNPEALTALASKAANPAVLCLLLTIGVDAIATYQFANTGLGILSDSGTPLDIDFAHLILMWIGFFLNVITIVAYSTWLSRSVRAVSAMSSDAFPFSPDMAVLYYFIPFLNLYRPFEVTKELFEWSTPRGEALSFWTKQAIGVWWMTWVIGGMSALIAGMARVAGMEVFALALSIISGIALITLIQELPKLQARKLAEWEPAPIQRTLMSPDLST